METLTWKGPIAFNKFSGKPDNNELNEKGLYLMCIKPNKNKDEYAVYYVGAAPLNSVSYTHLTLPTNREV